jgi:hypothetical protein
MDGAVHILLPLYSLNQKRREDVFLSSALQVPKKNTSREEKQFPAENANYRAEPESISVERHGSLRRTVQKLGKRK